MKKYFPIEYSKVLKIKTRFFTTLRMTKIAILILSILFLLFALNCKVPVAIEDTTFSFTTEDATCTEAFFKIKMATGIKKRFLTIKRENAGTEQTVFAETVNDVEMLYTDTTLLPSKTYTYTATVDSRQQSTTITTMDTTSHDFTWTTQTFGVGGSSSFNDVAIINDTLAYAVGQIFDGGPSTEYNLAKWNGTSWELKKIPFIGSCSAVDYPPLKAICAFSYNNIIVSNGGSIVKYDGANAVMDCRMNSLLTGAINKIYATDTNNIYLVGNSGSIVHYNGSVWQKIESGTGLNIYDIYGATNSKTGEQEILAVAGNATQTTDRKIIKLNGNEATDISSYPITQPLGSIWFVPNRYYFLAGGGIYNKRILSDIKWSGNPLDITIYSTTSIRGNNINDVVVCGAYGELLHFNGVSWKSYRSIVGLNNGSYGKVTISNNLIIAVGHNSSMAIICIGRR